MNRASVRVAACVLACAVTAPVFAQQAAKIAVIDVQRVLTESDRGKEAVQRLKQLQQSKVDQVKQLQQKVADLHDQYDKQQFALSPDKLAALQKQAEDAQISLKRAQDDAQREFDDTRRKALDALEQQIMPVIDQIGKEKGLTLIFNKFQSGLVYAADEVDITDEVIQRFNTTK